MGRPSVIERNIDGDEPVDTPSTYEKAEQIFGSRLDRRKSYCILEGEVCEQHTFTQHCTGCTELGENMGMAHHYEWDGKAQCHIGSGCHECGYRGKVRNGFWHPLSREKVS